LRQGELSEKMLLFDFPQGDGQTNFDLDTTLHRLIYTNFVEVESFGGEATRFKRSFWEAKDGKIIIRTSIENPARSGRGMSDVLVSNFELSKNGKSCLKIEVDPRPKGGVEIYESLHGFAEQLGSFGDKLKSTLTQFGLLSDLVMSKASFVLEGGKAGTGSEFEVQFSEENPQNFPAISVGFLQKDDKIYASAGPNIKEWLMPLNPLEGSHSKLINFIHNLQELAGFSDSDDISIGMHFPTTWKRIG